MADVNTSAIEWAIKRVENRVESLQADTEALKGQVSHVSSTVDRVSAELDALRADFVKMMQEQQRQAAIQKALTEIVRVRQEIDNKFGTHNDIRMTMIGILQATDKALVTQKTISRVSEELMISAPNYWLAPCLIAVAAWIGNDRELADRAIKEAVRRDEEKTSLTMALICRRNGRTDTCFEWLARYFANQSLNKFSAGTFSFVNAYINGVFGPDRKDLCSGYITKWLNEVRKDDANFEAEQEELWNNYCSRYQYSVANQYTALASSVEEFNRIDAYISRVNSVDAICENFKDIIDANVDIDKIKADIDNRLINLVNKCEKEEEILRDEEKLYQEIKTNGGDEERARIKIESERQNYVEETVNLVEQMVSAIVEPEGRNVSETKTAVSFLSDYINKGYNKYITEKEEAFPQQITLHVEDWTGTTTDGTNANELYASYEQHMNSRWQSALGSVNRNGVKNNIIIGSIIAGIGLIMLFLAPIIGIIGLIAGGVFFIRIPSEKRNVNARIDAINSEFGQRIVDGKNQIYTILQQWYDARNVIVDFRNKNIQKIIA